MADRDGLVDALLREGFDEIRARTGRSFVTVTDSVEAFHSHTTKTAALPSLSVAFMLFRKHGASLDARVDAPISQRLEEALVARWHALVDDDA